MHNEVRGQNDVMPEIYGFKEKVVRRIDEHLKDYP